VIGSAWRLSVQVLREGLVGSQTRTVMVRATHEHADTRTRGHTDTHGHTRTHTHGHTLCASACEVARCGAGPVRRQSIGITLSVVCVGCLPPGWLASGRDAIAGTPPR
jgi:hypothetical protein